MICLPNQYFESNTSYYTSSWPIRTACVRNALSALALTNRVHCRFLFGPMGMPERATQQVMLHSPTLPLSPALWPLLPACGNAYCFACVYRGGSSLLSLFPKTKTPDLQPLSRVACWSLPPTLSQTPEPPSSLPPPRPLHPSHTLAPPVFWPLLFPSRTTATADRRFCMKIYQPSAMSLHVIVSPNVTTWRIPFPFPPPIRPVNPSSPDVHHCCCCLRKPNSCLPAVPIPCYSLSFVDLRNFTSFHMGNGFCQLSLVVNDFSRHLS